MPNRILRESIRTSRSLASLSAEAERMFTRLITVADDTGRFDADPRVLKATCFPLLVDKIETSCVEKWSDELAACGVIQLYKIAGRLYGHFPNWSKYQRQYGTKPKFPGPPADSGEPPQPVADSRSYPVSENREKRSETKKRDPRDEGKIKEGEGVGSLGCGSRGRNDEREKLLKENANLLKLRARLRD